MDENKPGAIDSADDESAISDTALCRDARHPLRSRRTKLTVGGPTNRVGQLIKNKLPHQ